MFQEKTVNYTLIGLMRESGWTMRSIASVVILTFGSLMTLPAEAAIQQEIKQLQWHKPGTTNAAKLSAKLEETHQLLTKLATGDTKSLDLKASHTQVQELETDLQSLDKGAMDDFAANEARIQAHHLPAVIEQRQQDAVKTYRGRMDTLLTELKAADESKDTTTFIAHMNKAKQHLDEVQVKPFHEKFDPKNLPFSVAKPTGVKPRLSKKDYEARPVAPKKRAQVAANGSLAGILSAADVTGSLPTSPSDPSYVAPTDDVQITPAIQAQAAALHNDPVQIFNWVHNNVEYVPTYGSIQGSDMTLQTLKGNDFDQASLLIALLRASNVPSRYVYGTIQSPIAQVENWVGGVTDPNAALNLMSQGGIPVTGLVQGGQIKYAQLEHVWVEAWVNFVPSQAARSGPGNTWVSMDASFKQYGFTQPANITGAIGLDPTALISHAISSASINTDPSAPSISNIDLSSIETQTNTYVAQVSTYANGLDPKTTYSTIAGAKTAIPRTGSSLSAGLPYSIVSIGIRLANLPDALKFKFQYGLQDQDGNSVLQYSNSTSSLAGHTLALSFSPATAADQQALDSFMPSPTQVGDPIDFSKFPSALPAYLINVVPQLTLDGNVVATGISVPLGTQFISQKGFWDPQAGLRISAKPITAGQYQAVALDMQGISHAQVQSLETELSAAIQSLQSTTALQATKHDIVGATLELTGLSYFASNDSFDTISAKYSSVTSYRAPSFGTFSTVVQPIYTFGVVQSVRMPGTLMDMDGLRSITVSSDNSVDSQKYYTIEAGSRLSTFENVIPKTLFGTVDPNGTDVSAMVAIESAVAQGQAIYTITPSNLATATAKLNVSPDVLARIQDVVQAGEDVIIPQSPVSSGDWSGTGYTILDPVTGDGAYEISGAANGDQHNTSNNSAAPFTVYGFGGGVSEGGGAGVLSELGQDFLEQIDRIHSVYEINEACSGSDLVIATAFYAFVGALMQTVKADAAAGIAGFVEAGLLTAEAALFMNILIFVIFAVILAALVLTITEGCEGKPIEPPFPTTG